MHKQGPNKLFQRHHDAIVKTNCGSGGCGNLVSALGHADDRPSTILWQALPPLASSTNTACCDAERGRRHGARSTSSAIATPRPRGRIRGPAELALVYSLLFFLFSFFFFSFYTDFYYSTEEGHCCLKTLSLQTASCVCLSDLSEKRERA